MGTMNGIAMASKLSELGTKAFGDYGGVFIGDLRLQNELYEVSGKLRQFVNDMGTNGNCTQADIERFEDTLLGTDKTQYQASRAIMDQMAGIVDGDALANNIDEMGKNLMASNGDESLINALGETSDKLKQFVDDFGTNGRISEADMQKFDAMFAASDGNKYQASEATLDQVSRLSQGSDWRSRVTDGAICIGSTAATAFACDSFNIPACIAGSIVSAASCYQFAGDFHQEESSDLSDRPPSSENSYNRPCIDHCEIDPSTGEATSCQCRDSSDGGPDGVGFGGYAGSVDGSDGGGGGLSDV